MSMPEEENGYFTFLKYDILASALVSARRIGETQEKTVCIRKRRAGVEEREGF